MLLLLLLLLVLVLRLMCSKYSIHDRRFYTTNCSVVKEKFDAFGQSNGYTSDDLLGNHYDGKCPFYDGCGLSNSKKCILQDLPYTYAGKVGRIVALDNSLAVPTAWVTFNDGRTAVLFEQQYLQLEYRIKSMYGTSVRHESVRHTSFDSMLIRLLYCLEIWWVVRSKSKRVVQKRKGFNITFPQCTFDLTNNRYLYVT